ncbi:c-type cytochrome [Oharaeibacter diazotrophicus]|uniref:Cytochrome c n=1 Tax=Oharaeibacter diazotrophicus TaxID=1920512 RepID=A0A4R6RII8_9HYPH|nr:cytochrome c family protein [Oharaeibacter diazotrophicus]TDP86192.1 cytochrome c [Oharaeibacter diazotrophicus]BBE71867.1 cytochrome c2 [Pleomorphomonas sp. SM30]GLS78631.1 cytochrome c [Oharaeibacter diazotrophicus]
MKKILVLTAVAFAAMSSAALAGDPAAGEKVFKKCMACHAVGEGAKNKVGPALNGVVGSVIGKHPEDYQFSKALQEMGAAGKVWDEAALTEWLKSPKAFAPGTKMAFAGLKKDEEIADVIAYLETFK